MLALTGRYEQLLNYVVFADWIFFGLTVATLVVFRRTYPLSARPPGTFRAPGYPFVQIAFVIASAAVVGIDAYAVTIEVDSAQGLPQWAIVGLPAGAVRESRDRVGAALVNSGFTVPPRRMTVNTRERLMQRFNSPPK